MATGGLYVVRLVVGLLQHALCRQLFVGELLFVVVKNSLDRGQAL